MVLHKVLKYAVLGLCLIAAVFFFYTVSVGDEAIKMDTDGVQAVTLSPMMFLTYIVMLIAVALVVIFLVKNLLSSPQKLKSAGIAIGIAVVIIGVAYAFSNGNDADMFNELVDTGDDPLTSGESKVIGASLITFYIVGFLAVASIAWTGVSKLLKK
jgi:glucan phosphoethanolaminetransferase (alkaline phosphatase superfamily)